MSLTRYIGRTCRSRTREPSRPNHYVYWIIEFDSSVVDTWTKLRSSGTSIAQGLLLGRTQRLCFKIFPHYFDHDFRTKFPEGWVYVIPIFWLRHIFHSDLLQCIYLLFLDSTILHELCFGRLYVIIYGCYDVSRIMVYLWYYDIILLILHFDHDDYDN